MKSQSAVKLNDAHSIATIVRCEMVILAIATFSIVGCTADSFSDSSRARLQSSGSPDTTSGATTGSSPTNPGAAQVTILNMSADVGNALSLPFQSSSDGEELGTFWNAGQSFQIFQLAATGFGQYQIIETMGDRCLSVNGSNVALYPCSIFTNQLFTFNLQNDGTYAIQSANGYCLSANGSFAAVEDVACDQSMAQSWKLPASMIPYPNPSIQVSSSVANMVGQFAILNQSASQGNSLALPYQSSVDGEGLETYWDAAAPYEFFEIDSVGNNQYEIKDTMGDRCLSVNGSSVAIYPCEGFTNQYFSINQQSDGSFTIQSANGACLNAAGSFASLTAVSCDGSIAQEWSLANSAGTDVAFVPSN